MFRNRSHPHLLHIVVVSVLVLQLQKPGTTVRRLCESAPACSMLFSVGRRRHQYNPSEPPQMPSNLPRTAGSGTSWNAGGHPSTRLAIKRTKSASKANQERTHEKQSRCANELARKLPQELFERILRHIGGEGSAYTKRELGQTALVSRYWTAPCQAGIFRAIEIRSGQDVRDLLALLSRPETHMVQSVQSLHVPGLFLCEPPTAPWMHLLPLLHAKLPLCQLESVRIFGPLLTRTLRTIHPELPRALPAHSTRLRHRAPLAHGR